MANIILVFPFVVHSTKMAHGTACYGGHVGWEHPGADAKLFWVTHNQAGDNSSVCKL